MKIFFDASSFAKRYIDEDGSQQVEDLCMQATALGLSVLCVPEILSALNRRKRERSLTRTQYTTAKQCLLEEVRDADIINLVPVVVARAVDVLESSPLRAMDALHIACALQWQAERFVSADKQQIRAARKAGLVVETV